MDILRARIDPPNGGGANQPEPRRYGRCGALPRARNFPSMTALEVRHLHKRYGQHVAVDDVSFTVEEGEIFGIIGPNGAGKTTTVESIAGLRTPDSGTISVLGLDPSGCGQRRPDGVCGYR